MVGARGVGLVQPGGPIEVEAHDEGGDPEGPAAVALRVPLSTKDTSQALLNTLLAAKHTLQQLQPEERATRNAFSWLSPLVRTLYPMEPEAGT